MSVMDNVIEIPFHEEEIEQLLNIIGESTPAALILRIRLLNARSALRRRREVSEQAENALGEQEIDFCAFIRKSRYLH